MNNPQEKNPAESSHGKPKYVPRAKRNWEAGTNVFVQLPAECLHLVPKDFSQPRVTPPREARSLVLAITNTTGIEYGRHGYASEKLRKVNNMWRRGHKSLIHSIFVLGGEKRQIRNENPPGPKDHLTLEANTGIFEFFNCYPDMMLVVFDVWLSFRNYDQKDDPRRLFNTKELRALLLRTEETFKPVLPHFETPIQAYNKHGIYICNHIAKFICLALFLGSKIPPPHECLEKHNLYGSFSPDQKSVRILSIPQIQAAFKAETCLDFMSCYCKVKDLKARNYCIFTEVDFRYDDGGGTGDYKLIERARFGGCSCLEATKLHGLFDEVDINDHEVFVFEIEDRFKAPG